MMFTERLSLARGRAVSDLGLLCLIPRVSDRAVLQVHKRSNPCRLVFSTCCTSLCARAGDGAQLSSGTVFQFPGHARKPRSHHLAQKTAQQHVLRKS